MSLFSSNKKPLYAAKQYWAVCDALGNIRNPEDIYQNKAEADYSADCYNNGGGHSPLPPYQVIPITIGAPDKKLITETSDKLAEPRPYRTDYIEISCLEEGFKFRILNSVCPYTRGVTYYYCVITEARKVAEYVQACFQTHDDLEELIEELVSYDFENISTLTLSKYDTGYIVDISFARKDIHKTYSNNRWTQAIIKALTSSTSMKESNGGMADLKYGKLYEVTGPSGTFQVNCDKMFVDENRCVRFIGENPSIQIANCTPDGYYSCRLIAQRESKEVPSTRIG